MLIIVFFPVPNGPIAGPEEPQDNEPLNLDGRRKCEPTLRAIRKPDHSEDYLHSYKFKNSIERRFSKSQDCEVKWSLRFEVRNHNWPPGYTCQNTTGQFGPKVQRSRNNVQKPKRSLVNLARVINCPEATATQ